MGKLLAVWLLGMTMTADRPASSGLRRFEFTQTEMAVPIKIVLYSADSTAATRAASAAFARIHQLNGIMSDYDAQSELNRLCAHSGEGSAVPLSPDLWRVLEHAQSVSARSNGAFNVTVGPLVHLWRRARRRKELPPDDLLQAARALVGYRLVRLDPKHRAVELLRRGMQLDLGGIAKGYAVDEALAVLRQHGISRALVDAGGDLGLGNPPPDQPGWRIGLTPLDDPRPARYLVAANTAVSTSGDSVQYVELGGRRYSHIIDPRTGMALTDHCRVTVVARQGMAADALSKAVGVLGPQQGLRLIEQTPGAAVLILRAPNKGKVEQHESSGWKKLRIVGAEKPG